MPSQLSGSSAVAIQVYQTLYGRAPSNLLFNDYKAQATANPQQTSQAAASAFANELAGGFSTMTDAVLAKTVLDNINVTATTVTTPGSYTALLSALTQAFTGFGPASRGQIILNVSNVIAKLEGDATFGAAAALFNNQAYANFVYATNPGSVNPGIPIVPVNTYTLTAGIDNLTGTSAVDNFIARTVNNLDTLNDGDNIDGGAGIDNLLVDYNNNDRGGNAITPNLKNVENVYIRAQSTLTDSTNGNNTSDGQAVTIDAQRSLAVDAFDKVTAASGVTRWETNNSRSDVIIEDVRIGNAQKTSDVTIAMVETDPGNVDFAVYFDQLSLRNASSGTSILTINLMDTGAAGQPATAATPLLNQPYDQFKFAINGVLSTIQLDKVAVAAADTYEALLAVFQAALGPTGVTIALGNTFTITDPISNKPVTGKSIVITAGAGIVITTPTGSGWFNTTGASVPATSNIYTTFATGLTSVSELVTSKVILDDVGRGSTGGDLLIGGQSLGFSSTSRGVERFEIQVLDNSKLQTINGTNNALREVTIVNGTTSSAVTDAYTNTVVNEGNLTVNGTNFPGSPVIIARVDADLNGVNTNTANATPGAAGVSVVPHSGNGSAGFTDVRLIDASAFKGKLEFTAVVTSDSINKYINLVDTQADPAGDVAGAGNVNFNVRGANFIYTGGNDNDTMVVSIDAGVASSNSRVVSGQSDFTFNISGGEGNDAITLNVINTPALTGGAQAWYTNQKLNANIRINSGDGNDTIRIPGAGDVIIDAGTGNDTVYSDNTGTLGATARATGTAGTASIALTNDSNAEFAAASAAYVASNTTGFVTVAATGSAVSTAAVSAALNALNLATPIDFNATITRSSIETAINTATAGGGLTFAQELALNAAYNVTTGGTVVPATTLVAQAITTEAPVAGNLTAAEFAAGNALLETYIAAAKAAAALATANDANKVANQAVLDPTQTAVANATDAINRVFDPVAAIPAGTATTVANLATLVGAVAVGATAAQVVTALQTAVDTGAILPGDATTLFGNLGPFPVAAAGSATANLLLAQLVNNAANANAAANVALTAATTAYTNAVNAAATGINAAATAAAALAEATAAATAVTTYNNTVLTPATTKAADLAALKAGIVGAAAAAGATSELAVSLLTANAVAKGTITAGDKTAIDTAANAGAPTVGGFVNLAEKVAVDLVITALQLPAEANVATFTLTSANLQTISTAAATANTIAQAAANSGGTSVTAPGARATFVFNTADQTALYNKATQDERNLADLKSDVNNTYNFFNATVKVTYKGIDASLILAGTNFRTTDLELNQAIKLAVNSDAVLSKLLLVTDGPANSLVVTSLIDGGHTTAMLGVTVTLPVAITAADLAGAAAAYGLGAGVTEAGLIGAGGINTVAKAAFDLKGDYVTQFAESGANGTGADVLLIGAKSLTTSDNTITPGSGNDVIVLGTTVDVSLLTSSNEVLVYAPDFGNDTIVNFAVAGNGVDQLNFSALNGRAANFNSLSADKSIVIGAATALPLSNAAIAALFTDSAAAINHVYVQVDLNNIGSIYTVADAAGVAAGNVTATLVGTIDLADTLWSTMTAANFV